MYETGFYFDWIAAAFVRGVWKDPALAYACDESLPLDSPLESLSREDFERIVRAGLASGLRLHRFKRTTDRPRIWKVLSILQGIEPTSLLDIGSGHGAFLWALLDAFPKLPVTAVDREEARVAVIKAVADGGVHELLGYVQDAARLSFDNAEFDVVTLLEVIEHVPEAMRALVEAVRVARRYVILSVPSREERNPHHTHLFTAERLTEMLLLAGATRVTTDKVHDHMIVIGRISRI
jgi:2-polyprenyl-3-methyl-5-hydroxy-6-metoxy-1,4-benzoquinol methylase